MGGSADTELTPEQRRIGDFAESARVRREAMHAASINQRLSRLNALCRQLSAVRLRRTER